MTDCVICGKDIHANYDNNPDILPLCSACYSIPKPEIERLLRELGLLPQVEMEEK